MNKPTISLDSDYDTPAGEFSDTDPEVDLGIDLAPFLRKSTETTGEKTDVSMLGSMMMTGSPMTQAALILSSAAQDSPDSAIHICLHQPLPAAAEVVLPQCSCRHTLPSARGALRATALPSACENPATAAAHLHLLGEALLLIGHCLQETDKPVCVSTSLCVLLDSLLCTLAPLMSLASHVPELQGCLEHTADPTLENVSYLMPGL